MKSALRVGGEGNMSARSEEAIHLWTNQVTSQMQSELSKDASRYLHVIEVVVGIWRIWSLKYQCMSSSGHILDSETLTERIFKVSKIPMRFSVDMCIECRIITSSKES